MEGLALLLQALYSLYLTSRLLYYSLHVFLSVHLRKPSFKAAESFRHSERGRLASYSVCVHTSYSSTVQSVHHLKHG